MRASAMPPAPLSMTSLLTRSAGRHFIAGDAGPRTAEAMGLRQTAGSKRPAANAVGRSEAQDSQSDLRHTVAPP